MRRSLRFGAAAIGVAALTLGVGAPASAQEPLGFQIDKTQGLPGEVVNGQVDVADVAEHCNNDADVLEDRFDATADVLLEEVDDAFFEGGFDPTDPEAFRLDNFEQASWVATQTTAGNVSGQRAEEALPQTFVMTFADILTQQPVGERANYDPAVGEAAVTVPDVEPGLWAVAATCVSPSTDPAVLADAVRANAPLVEEWLTGGGFEDLIGVPFPGFPITNPDFALAIGLGGALAIGETLVPPLMVPEALGVQLFTVLTPQEALAGVIDDIEALVADGALTGGYAQGLTRPLETAIRSLDGGNADAACDQLDGVSDRSIPGSILDAGSAGDLIARVEAVEAHLGCT
jgi:hypothetical protein